MVYSVDVAHNQGILAKIRPGDWVASNAEGRLYLIQGIWDKFLFCVKIFFDFFGQTMEKTREIIKRTHLAALQDPQLVIEGRTAEAFKQAHPNRDSQMYPESMDGMVAGLRPEPIGEGTSGSYFMRDRKGKILAVYKPKELEVGAELNPKQAGASVDVAQRFGIPVGGCYLRETAAYLLDLDHFAKVPETETAKMPGAPFGYQIDLEGSLQSFISGCASASEYQQILPSALTRSKAFLIPAEEIRRLAILDIRLLNGDRKMGNFLVDGQYKIHPIDHGLTLPGNASELSFRWMYFNQARTPFSQEEREYIQKLDPAEDAMVLERLDPKGELITEGAIKRMKAATLLLQYAALERNLTPFEIGRMMIGQPSSTFQALRNHFVPVTVQTSQFELQIFPKLQNCLDSSKEEQEEVLKGIVDEFFANKSLFFRWM